MRSFKSNENIHKKEGGSYYVVSANKASSVTLQAVLEVFSETGMHFYAAFTGMIYFILKTKVFCDYFAV